MAGLNISGATQGFDVSGARKYVEDLKTYMIGEAKGVLTDLDTINSTVDSVWKGSSANIYKSNFKTDVDEICKAIDEAEAALEGAIENTEQNFANLDATIISKRNSGGGER